MKNGILSIALLVLIVLLANPCLAEDRITNVDGGSVTTVLTGNIKVNENSSLRREWITVYQGHLPVTFTGDTGVKTEYVRETDYSRGGYNYSAVFKINPNVPISAIEVRFLTFDIWGDHSRNLSSTEIEDLAANVEKTLEPRWDVYSENEVSEFYASIAYIAQVRTADGKVFKADTQSILEQARKFSDKFTEADLNPTPEKE